MTGIVLTFPIVAGKVEAWRRFCQEMSFSRKPDHEASRLRHGITLERLTLIETAFGSAAVTTLEADDIVQALNNIVTSDLPFDHWYWEQIKTLHGINLTRYEPFSQPTPPPESQETLFEWSGS